MFTRRQKTLIMEILKTDDYITSHQLALNIGVSIRTIKGEIKSINELLFVYDICVEAKTGLGYRMNTMGKKAIPDINYLLEDMNYDNFIQVTNSMEDRIHYIACRLLTANDNIKSEILADELYISTSTLSHDLKQLKYIFKIYGLKILSKPYKGLYLSGKEKHIRNCIDFLCFKNTTGAINPYEINGEGVDHMIESLYQILSKIAETYHFAYPVYSLRDIAVQSYIAMKRIQQGKILKDEDYESSLSACQIAEEYVIELERIYHLHIPIAEVKRLQCMIDTLYIVEDMKDVEQNYRWLLEDTFQEIRMTYDFDFKQDFSLTDSLLLHIRQLVKRCRSDVLIWNPLAKRILSNYLLSVDFANILARKLEDNDHFKISIDEFSYLVLYFNVTIYSGSHMKDKAIYIYCPGSRAEEQMIAEEVKHLFNEIVNKITIVNKEELASTCFSSLDMIVTNHELPSLVPAYVQTVFADLNHRMEFIFHILTKLNEPVEGCFNINELLSESMFYTNQNLSSKDEYFEFLFDSLCDSMMMDYGEAGYLYERVEKFGQEVGHHVVLVRSQNHFVMPFIHVTSLKDMFYWDTGYAKLIIFVNFGDSDVSFRDYIYQRLKSIFANREKIDKLCKSMDFKTFVDNLNHF